MGDLDRAIDKVENSTKQAWNDTKEFAKETSNEVEKALKNFGEKVEEVFNS